MTEQPVESRRMLGRAGGEEGQGGAELTSSFLIFFASGSPIGERRSPGLRGFSRDGDRDCLCKKSAELN